MTIVIVLLVIVAIVVGALMMRRGGNGGSSGSAPSQQYQGQVPQDTTTFTPPPSTRDLDEETAARPEIDAAALASARASVSQAIPDEVLQDVLLDATPQQAAKLFAGVSQEVMAGAIGQQTSGVHIQGQAGADDLAKLGSLSSAVDDLDIWNFGDDTHKA